MRRAVSVLCCAVLSGAVVAVAAEPTLDDVIARLGEPAVVRGSYEQSRELAILERPLVSNGDFILSERGLYWHQQSQPAAVVIADGQRLVQIIGDNPPEVSDDTSNPMLLPFSRIFLGLFRGDEKGLRENFEIDFAADGDGWRLRLEPKTEPLSLAIEAIALSGDQHIDELTVVNRSADRTIIRFFDLRTEPDHLTEHEIELYAR